MLAPRTLAPILRGPGSRVCFRTSNQLFKMGPDPSLRRSSDGYDTEASLPRRSTEAAEAIALQGLAFLAEDPARMLRFLKLTGLGAGRGAGARRLARAFPGACWSIWLATNPCCSCLPPSRGVAPGTVSRPCHALLEAARRPDACPQCPDDRIDGAPAAHRASTSAAPRSQGVGAGAGGTTAGRASHRRRRATTTPPPSGPSAEMVRVLEQRAAADAAASASACRARCRRRAGSCRTPTRRGSTASRSSATSRRIWAARCGSPTMPTALPCRRPWMAPAPGRARCSASSSAPAAAAGSCSTAR